MAQRKAEKARITNDLTSQNEESMRDKLPRRKKSKKQRRRYSDSSSEIHSSDHNSDSNTYPDVGPLDSKTANTKKNIITAVISCRRITLMCVKKAFLNLHNTKAKALVIQMNIAGVQSLHDHLLREGRHHLNRTGRGLRIHENENQLHHPPLQVLKLIRDILLYCNSMVLCK